MMRINKISSVFLTIVLVMGTVSTVGLYENVYGDSGSAGSNGDGLCVKWAGSGHLKAAIKCFEEAEEREKEKCKKDGTC